MQNEARALPSPSFRGAWKMRTMACNCAPENPFLPAFQRRDGFRVWCWRTIPERRASAFSQRAAPEFSKTRSLANRGRRENRVLQCTRSLACENRKHASQSTTGSPEIPGLPCANGFNGFLCGLPGDRAFLPPSPAGLPAGLMPASRHQDATTSPSALHAFVLRVKASIASRSQRS
jgi:hypothetical protein